jgi:hypothetical protein
MFLWYTDFSEYLIKTVWRLQMRKVFVTLRRQQEGASYHMNAQQETCPVFEPYRPCASVTTAHAAAGQQFLCTNVDIRNSFLLTLSEKAATLCCLIP